MVVNKQIKFLIKAALILGLVYLVYKYLFQGLANVDNSMKNYSLAGLSSNSAQDQLPINKSAQNFVDQLAQVDLSEDLLTTGQNINLNTIPTSRKNPNLQLRSEPLLTETVTGPWNNSTIVPTYTPRPLGL